jgi:flavin reductase (DIM6/NTAB) family NADH-FMN oxidoreductase RutF
MPPVVPHVVIDLSEGETALRELRHALARFATGVTVITTKTAAGKTEGLTANSFSSVSMDPPLVLWSLRNSAASRVSFLAAEWFAINVLSLEQQHHSQHFANAASDKFISVACRPGLGGCPLLADTIASFECQTERVVEVGDHSLFIGRVIRAAYRDGAPLLFHAGSYHAVAPVASLSDVPESAKRTADSDEAGHAFQ